KGIKLYSTSIPMLLACLRGLLAQRGGLSAAEAGGLLVKVRAAVSAAAAAASASSSAAAHTAAHSAATKAGTAAAAKASSSAVGVKIVAGLLVAAMAAGGAVAVPKMAHQVQEKQVEQQTQSAEELAAVQADYDQNTAYLNVISELQEQFGERTDISRNAYSGLLTAKLVDFDGDGEDELFCIYNDGSIRNSVGNTDGVNIGSWFSVYSWDGERANRVTWGPLYHNKTYRVSWHATYTLPTGGCYLYKKEGDPKTYLCWPIVSTYEIDEKNDSNRTVMGISDWMREYTIEDGEWKAVSDISATRDLNTGAITSVGFGTAAEGDEHWTPQEAEEELSAIRRDGEYFRSTFFHDGTDYSLSGEDAYIFQAAKKIPYYPQTPANGFEPPEAPDALIQSLLAQTETDKQQLGDSFREYTEPTKTPEQLKATAEDTINEGLQWDNVYYYELGSATNSQVGMNYAAGRTDYWWQHTCSVLMDCLKQTLSANEYSALEQEQQAWEKQAEQQAEAAGMEAAGGSAQKMLIWDKSGELYQERAMQLKDKLAQVLGMTIES
uniref:lysozyme inhibitor LprI family protein n=1 Tax=Butyricicoccus sp. AF18-9LB TaxID=3002521 RepID=UPI0022E1E7F9